MFRWSSSRFLRSSSRSASVRSWPRSRATVSLNVPASCPISSVDRTRTSDPEISGAQAAGGLAQLQQGLADPAPEEGTHHAQADGRQRQHADQQAGQRPLLGAQLVQGGEGDFLSWPTITAQPRPSNSGTSGTDPCRHSTA